MKLSNLVFLFISLFAAASFAAEKTFDQLKVEVEAQAYELTKKLCLAYESNMFSHTECQGSWEQNPRVGPICTTYSNEEALKDLRNQEALKAWRHIALEGFKSSYDSLSAEYRERSGHEPFTIETQPGKKETYIQNLKDIFDPQSAYIEFLVNSEGFKKAESECQTKPKPEMSLRDQVYVSALAGKLSFTGIAALPIAKIGQLLVKGGKYVLAPIAKKLARLPMWFKKTTKVVGVVSAAGYVGYKMNYWKSAAEELEAFVVEREEKLNQQTSENASSINTEFKELYELYNQAGKQLGKAKEQWLIEDFYDNLSLIKDEKLLEEILTSKAELDEACDFMISQDQIVKLVKLSEQETNAVDKSYLMLALAILQQREAELQEGEK